MSLHRNVRTGAVVKLLAQDELSQVTATDGEDTVTGPSHVFFRDHEPIPPDEVPACFQPEPEAPLTDRVRAAIERVNARK